MSGDLKLKCTRANDHSSMFGVLEGISLQLKLIQQLADSFFSFFL